MSTGAKKPCWTPIVMKMNAGIRRKLKPGNTMPRRKMLLNKAKNGRNRSGANGTLLMKVKTNGQIRSGKSGIPPSGTGPLKSGVIGNVRLPRRDEDGRAVWFHRRFGTRPFDAFQHADRAGDGGPPTEPTILPGSTTEVPSYDFESVPSISDVAADELLEAASTGPVPMEGIVEEEPEPEGDEERSDDDDSHVSFDETLEEFYEDPRQYENLEGDDYQNYRFAMLGGAIGVEHWLVNKIKFFRIVRQHGLDHNDGREVWAADLQLKELMRILAEVQISGPSARLKVIRYLVDKTRYVITRGHRNETMSETSDPDGYAAAHYGYGGEAFVSSDSEMSEVNFPEAVNIQFAPSAGSSGADGSRAAPAGIPPNEEEDRREE